MAGRTKPSFLVLAALAFVLVCESKFAQHDAAEELTPDNFKSKVINGKELWVVAFYAPWCGHCKALAPEWQKLAGAISPSIRVGAVDADAHKDIGGQYQVSGFPTIKLFGSNKKAPQDYNGARTAAAIAQAALKLLQDQVAEKLGGGRPKSSSSGGGGGGGSKGGGSGKEYAVILNTQDFEEKVLQSKDEWLVQFMAPWCGHCQKLKPEWEEAAKKLAGDYKFGIVDATQESGLGQKYDVKGYPTIKHFKQGADGKKEVVDYNGGRVAADFVQFVEARLEQVGSVAPIAEIVKTDTFNAECDPERSGIICVVAFLPNILDDQASGRNARLAKLTEARKKAGRTFRFMWVVGGENSELEEKLGLGFGFPALVAISPTKKRFSVMRQAFSPDNIAAYLGSVLRGREPTSELKPWPVTFRKLDPWDGKDAPPPPVEDPLDE